MASVPRLKTNPPVLLGCFVVPNHVLQARFPLAYFKAPMDFIEDRAGLDLSALRRFIHKQHGPSSTHSWTPFDVGVQLEAALSGVSEGSVADKINIAYEKQMCGFQKPTSVSADKENSNKCSRFHLTPPEKLLQAVDMCRHLDLVDVSNGMDIHSSASTLPWRWKPSWRSGLHIGSRSHRRQSSKRSNKN